MTRTTLKSRLLPGPELRPESKSKILFLLPLMLASQVAAQGFVNLYSFTAVSGTLRTNSDGAAPNAGLIFSGNKFYGTTIFGGGAGNGTVFAINIDGTGFTNLHNFSKTVGSFNTNADGITPYGGLVLLDNTLYGTAFQGGKWANGTVFALNIDGTGFRTLHHFTATSNIYPSANTNSDGARPMGGLVLSGNTLYGTTDIGGLPGNGTVFGINTDGTGFTNLHVFSTAYFSPGMGDLNGDGVFPVAGLILSSNTLYGTTSGGGIYANGTVFCVHTNGTGFLNLHNFSAFKDRFRTNSDGGDPIASLILSSNTLYGTARSGGAWGDGTVFKVHTDGSGFATLHNFTGRFVSGVTTVPGVDGGGPDAGLVLSNGTLYGTTIQGGMADSDNPSGYGIVFAIGTDGNGFAPVYRFNPTSTTNFVNNDGAYPTANLLLMNDTLYGTAEGGGISGSGSIFSLPVSLRPPPPPQIPDTYASFTTSTIQSVNITITPGAYFTYNATSGGSWGIAAQSFGFLGTFAVPVAGAYTLTVNHQTSPAASCPGGGYSPVNIFVNGTQIASNFDPAQQNGGSLAEVTNTWTINAMAGENSFQWVAGPLCSRYWIQGIQVTPASSQALPQLTITSSGSNIILAWPTNAIGFALQSTTDLTHPAAWMTVSSPPNVLNGQNLVTNSIANTRQFYRLSQ